MSYLNRKERIFRSDGSEIGRARSESRMKNYQSATDRRAWCDEVELRRQHILSLPITEGKSCIDDLLSLDALFDVLGSRQDGQDEEALKDRITYLEQSVKIYRDLALSSDQKAQLDKLVKTYDIKHPDEYFNK